MRFKDFIEKTEILILCGGRGTRLSSVIEDVPKPMAPLGDGKPFLEHQVNFMLKMGFKNYCFLTGYKAEIIKNYFQNKEDISIRYSHEATPLGTAGAIRLALKNSNLDYFICLNGDSILNTDIISSYEDFFNQEKRKTTLLLKGMENFSRYGCVDVDESGNILKFNEKEFREKGEINAGVYFFEKTMLNDIDESDFSLENETFLRLVQRSMLKGYKVEGEFIDIGIPEDYERSKTLIPKWLNH